MKKLLEKLILVVVTHDTSQSHGHKGQTIQVPEQACALRTFPSFLHTTPHHLTRAARSSISIRIAIPIAIAIAICGPRCEAKLD